MTRRHPILIILVILCAGLNGSRALAHSMYQSSLMLDFHANSIEIQMELPPSRLQKVFGEPVAAERLNELRPRLDAYIASQLRVEDATHAAWTIRQASPLTWQVVDGAPYVVAHLTASPAIGASVRRFRMTDRIITDTLPTHAILVSVRSDWNSSTFASDPELLGVLNSEEPSIDVDRSAGGWTKGFGSIFHLGIRHIAEGTDHLLFLLELLLPAPLLAFSGRWASPASVRHALFAILKVVTAFTIGHSLTLALAASGLVHVPSNPIEILIAVSILISAVHALRPLFPGREAFIAGSFGLIHGLAFATTLAELGLRGWERVGSILAFNLGIEAMQLLVVLCVMPSLVLLSRTRLYPSFRIAGACFASLAAAGWIIERTFSEDLHVDAFVDGLAKHSIVFVASLFLISAASYVMPALRQNTKRPR